MLVLARTLQTAPAAEPVSVAEAREHCRITHTDEDTYLGVLIKAARRWCENETGLAFITQTWDFGVDCFWGADSLELPRAPLQSVTSITYVDTDGDSQTLDSDTYTADTATMPGRIYLAYSQSWPDTRAQPLAVTVRAVCGFGDASTDVPEEAIHAVKMLVGTMYEHRETTITGTIVSEVPTASLLLSSIAVPEAA